MRRGIYYQKKKTKDVELQRHDETSFRYAYKNQEPQKLSSSIPKNSFIRFSVGMYIATHCLIWSTCPYICFSFALLFCFFFVFIVLFFCFWIFAIAVTHYFFTSLGCECVMNCCILCIEISCCKYTDRIALWSMNLHSAYFYVMNAYFVNYFNYSIPNQIL